MAIIKCEDCNQDVSTEAVACPHCGREMPKEKGHPFISFMLWSFGGIVGLIVLVNLFQSKDSGYKYDAKSDCELAIKSALKSPGTADFTDVVVAVDGTRYDVRGSVDAQNGFGATVRTKYGCGYDAASGRLERKTVCLEELGMHC